LNEENNVVPDKNIPRMKIAAMREMTWKEYGRMARMFSSVRNGSRSGRGVASESELAFPGKGARRSRDWMPSGLPSWSKIGQQTMELDFLKKPCDVQGATLLAAANGNVGSMSKSGKRPKRGSGERLCRQRE